MSFLGPRETHASMLKNKHSAKNLAYWVTAVNEESGFVNHTFGTGT